MANTTITYNESHGRVPLIPLDYSHRNERRLRELMVDYKNGNLYVVSDTDIDKIFDLTKSIIEKVSEGIVGDDIVVNIEGIGEINLNEFLEYLTSINISSEAYGGAVPVPTLMYDNNSIGIIDNKVEIVDFSEATEGTIPQKHNGRLIWVNAGIGSGNTSIIDGDIQNNVLALELNKVTRLLQPPSNFIITMPDDFAGQSYGKTELYIDIKDTVPTITFPSNVKLEYNTDPTLFAHSIAVYEFETFTGGDIWLAKVTKWINELEQEITESYIHENFDWKQV